MTHKNVFNKFSFGSLDFLPRGDVFARFTHLQHVPFNISMSVNNASGANRMGLARIFMAPKIGFNRQSLSFNEQRLLMIEIDKFVVQCKFVKFQGNSIY